jgi:hypothetical protein
MGKARRLIGLATRQRIFLPILATSIAILGAISALFGIVDIHLGTTGTCLLAALILLSSGVFHLWRLEIPQIAVDDIIAPDDDNHAPLNLHCPCDRGLALEATKLAEDCYSGGITIEPQIYEQLRVKNPLILSCLTDQRGRFVGYFDVIPLDEPFARSLIQGQITELQMSHEDVLTPQQMKSCKYLFIAGIAVHEPDTYAGRRHASILVWALLQYMKRYYRSSNALVFALAATREGDELLQRFKLRPAAGDKFRTDHSKLYTIDISEGGIAQRLACVPNWDQLCNLPWIENRNRQGKARARRAMLPQAKALNLA